MNHTRLGAMAAACALAATLTGCGAGGHAANPIKPHDKIDVDGWRDELVATGRVRQNPDMAGLEESARFDCKSTVDDLAYGLTLTGSDADLTRIGMKYVCPTRADNVDKALRSIQDAMKPYDAACAVEPGLRTTEQRDLIDAIGPCDE